MPREILRITPEATYGVYNSSGTHTVIDLPSDNAFTMRVAPDFWEVRSAGSDNRVTLTGSSFASVAGSLTMLGRPSQSALLASILFNISGSCPTLPSFTIDHGIFIEDASCTPKLRRYRGCVASGSFDMTNQGNSQLMMWKLDIMGSGVDDITLTDFPLPAYTAYAWGERPFEWLDSTGAILYGGVDITPYVESLSFDVGSVIKSFRANTRFPSRVKAFGREPKTTMKMIYYTQQTRVDFEANTAKSLDITFTDPLGDILHIALGAANYLRQVGDDLHLGDFHRQTIMLMNCLDPSTGTDLAVTYTPHT